jgi:hypothetical protein
LIYQDSGKGVILFIDNENEKIMKKFQKLLNAEGIIVTRIHFPNPIKRFKFLNQIKEFLLYYDGYDVCNPKKFLDWQRAILEKIIRNLTRSNIEKLTNGFKVGKKNITDVKIFQTIIESEILKIDIRIFISV